MVAGLPKKQSNIRNHFVCFKEDTETALDALMGYQGMGWGFCLYTPGPPMERVHWCRIGRLGNRGGNPQRAYTDAWW